jgi:hypothetical protein
MIWLRFGAPFHYRKDKKTRCSSVKAKQQQQQQHCDCWRNDWMTLAGYSNPFEIAFSSQNICQNGQFEAMKRSQCFYGLPVLIR